VEHALTGGGDGASCQCQWWTITNARFQGMTRDEREGLLRAEVGDPLPPGLVAYVDGEPAGWVRVGPRVRQERLARTREFADATAEPWDAADVWAVSCFVVRREHRGAGLMGRLLDAAVAFAREHGARVVEGYPIDPTVAKRGPNQLYRGVLSVFEDAGFRLVERTKPDRALVSLDLGN
jgi:GNAT superfamily N-acetyltransferase